MADDDPLRATIKGLTLLLALAAYGLLAGYLIWQTWKAASGTTPDVPGVQAAALGGLAVALGAGYAAVLGVTPNRQRLQEIRDKSGWQRFKAWINFALFERTMLGAGVVLYLVAGAAICVTYALNESETPSILQSVAVGFAGYVVAYLGAAYQKFGAT